MPELCLKPFLAVAASEGWGGGAGGGGKWGELESRARNFLEFLCEASICLNLKDEVGIHHDVHLKETEENRVSSFVHVVHDNVHPEHCNL